MTCPKIHGWGVWNDCEVARVDELAVFADDDAALAHVVYCKDCAAKLGARLAGMLIEDKCYGWWTIDPTIHYADHVTPAMLAKAGEWDEEEEG